MSSKTRIIGDLEPSELITIVLDGDVDLTGATIQIFTGSYSTYNDAANPFHADFTGYIVTSTAAGNTQIDGVHQLRPQDTAIADTFTINARIVWPGNRIETIKGAVSKITVAAC